MRRLSLITVALLAVAPLAGMGQEITGPTSATVGEPAEVAITAEQEGRHTLILVGPQSVRFHELMVEGEVEPPPPDPIEAMVAVMIERADKRKVEIGRILGSAELALYVGPHGTFRAIDADIVDENDHQPDRIQALVSEAGPELPRLLLLDSQGEVIRNVDPPRELEAFKALLPRPPPTRLSIADVDINALLTIKELATLRRAGAAVEGTASSPPLADTDAARLPIPQPMPAMLEHGPSAYPWGAQEQSPGRPPADGEFVVLDRENWQETNHRHYVWHVFSQQDGHCTSNATAMQVMLTRFLSGMADVILSPEGLYGIHSRWGTGSTLWENLRAAENYGICDRDTIPPHAWRRSSWPEGWDDNAKRHRVLKSLYFTGTSDEIFNKVATALQHSWAVNIGVVWPGGGGHSIVALDLVQYQGEWAILILNSWGPEWGNTGLGVLTYRQCRTLDKFGAHAIQSVTLPSDEVDGVLSAGNPGEVTILNSWSNQQETEYAQAP